MTEQLKQRSDCRLCVEIYDFQESLFAKKYPAVLDGNVFFETARLQVMIPVGPFCEGHLLVASKHHAWSFGHLDHFNGELEELLVKLCMLVRETHGRAIVFEHGPISYHERGGCCLDHAHMNIMPVPEGIDILGSAARFARFEACRIEQLSDFVKRSEPYLFFQEPDQGSFAAVAPDGSQQFFRRVVAACLPRREWDWRSNPNATAVRSTAEWLAGLP